MRGRAIGFQGSLCLLDAQVEALNRGFTPMATAVEAARQLVAAYQAGVAQGIAVLTQGDRIIDRGAARQAQQVLDRAAACAARDAAKTAALARPPLVSPRVAS